MMYPYFQEAEALINIGESICAGYSSSSRVTVNEMQSKCNKVKEYVHLKNRIRSIQDWYKSNVNSGESFSLDFSGITEYDEYEVIMLKHLDETNIINNHEKYKEYIQRRDELSILVYKLSLIVPDIYNKHINYISDLEYEHEILEDRFQRCNDRLISYEKFFLFVMFIVILIVGIVNVL